MHFSVPDEGPLADADTYMPDFMELLAKGITKNEKLVTDAVSQLAGAMGTNLSGPVGNLGGSVEAAFERAMMLRDGRDPLKTDVAAHLHATAETVSAVAAYCGVTERQARTAIRSMVRSSRLLRAPDAFRRGLLHACLRIAGSRSVIDMIVPAQDKPVHAKGNAALAACYARALEKAVSLIGNLRGFLAGEEALDEAFSSNYESEEKI